MLPAKMAETYFQLAQQHRSVWTHELDLGVDKQYLEVVLSAIWEQDLKMDDPEVVLSALNAGGMDGEKIMELIQTDPIKETLKANTQAAADRGVFGIPTFFVEDEMFFGKERLGQVEEELSK